MDSIELEIKRSLEEIPTKAQEEQWNGESSWTRGVKQAIVNVGRKFGYLTAANGCDSDDGVEWLYDIVWYQNDEDNHIIDVPLVAECEWGNEGSIKYDFEKLLIANSKYRLMIFQSSSDDNAHELVNKILLWHSKFIRKSIGDRLLLACWSFDHWIFEQYLVDK